jgi:hypothetical protein
MAGMASAHGKKPCRETFRWGERPREPSFVRQWFQGFSELSFSFRRSKSPSRQGSESPRAMTVAAMAASKKPIVCLCRAGRRNHGEKDGSRVDPGKRE